MKLLCFGELIDETLDEHGNKAINIKEYKRAVRKKGDRKKLVKLVIILEEKD